MKLFKTWFLPYRSAVSSRAGQWNKSFDELIQVVHIIGPCLPLPVLPFIFTVKHKYYICCCINMCPINRACLCLIDFSIFLFDFARCNACLFKKFSLQDILNILLKNQISTASSSSSDVLLKFQASHPYKSVDYM